MSKLRLAENFKQQFGFVAMVVISTFFFFIVFGPAQPVYPIEGLDPSWMWVLNHAYLSGWQWGGDIVFTFGPWGFVYTRLFTPGEVLNQLIAWFAISLSLAIFVADRCSKSNALYVLIALFSVSVASIDALLMAVCIFPVLQNSSKKSYSIPVVVLYILTASMLGLVKSTFLILALVTVLLLDLKRVSKKELPYGLLLFIVFSIFFYITAGQNISIFPEFIVSSIDIISGYGAAMNATGKTWQVVIFLCLVVILIASVIKNTIWAEINSNYNISLLAIAIYLFFCFKNGFVRHDSHALTAFSGLTITTFLIYSTYKNPKSVLWTYSLLGVAIISSLLFIQEFGGRWVLQSKWESGIQTGLVTMDVLSHRNWYSKNLRNYEDAKLSIRQKYPIKMEGSVDILSSNQSALIANDLLYIPRPIFQEFAAYTPSLAEINFKHFLNNPPDHFLFSPESIDKRHLNLSDGYLWPLLFNCYSLNGYILIAQRLRLVIYWD